MKYLIVVTDGAGDRPLDSIGGLTALQKADMRYINELAKTGVIGTVKTVPDNMPPGSDVANLSVMGYDPAIVSVPWTVELLIGQSYSTMVNHLKGEGHTPTQIGRASCRERV